MLTCPSRSTLARLGHDSLDGPELAAIEAHVQICEACYSFLEERRSQFTADSITAALPDRGHRPRIPGFEIEDEIGRGGMGVVYRAWQPRLNRRVALKVVPSGPMAGARERKHWLAEAHNATRVRHRNVVQIHDAGEADGWLYLVLEFVAGGSLEKRLSGPLPPPAAAELMEQIAEAIIEVHQSGLLHLDLKPANILLDSTPGAAWREAAPKVADFGIARPLAGPGSSTISDAGPWGTPSYMAPEQVTADSAAIGPVTDVYALGAILYELLTGRPPFEAATPLETLDQVRHQEPAPPRRLNPAIARDLETICLTCLHKEPGRRYGTVRLLVDDLRRWLDGRPIEARPVSRPERAWRWCRRRPVVAALAGTLALALATGFPSILVLWRRAEAAHRGAEADFQTTIEVLGQVVDPIVPSNTRQVLTRDRRNATLRQTKRSLVALIARRPSHLVIAHQLRVINRALGYALMEQGRLDEARSHFGDSLRSGESATRNNPRDHLALRDQIYTRIGLAQLAETQERPEEGLSHLRRAFDAGEALRRIRPDAESTWLLAEIRHKLAGLLTRQGDLERARSQSAAIHHMIEYVPTAAKSPEVTTMRAFIRLEADRVSRGSATTSGPDSRNDGSGERDLLAILASPEVVRLPARTWAELAAPILRSAAGTGIESPLDAAACRRLVEFLGTLAAHQRHAGQVDASRLTADRMLVLGRLLVTRHPDEAAAHLALCEAYYQIYKIAEQHGGPMAIEGNLRLSLSAALQAQVLDPTSELAALLVDQRQQKLRALLDPP